MKDVLITTTSFQDTPGKHHELLKSLGWNVTYARGPLSEDQIFNLVGDHDGIICGDDVYSRRVLEKAMPRLQFLSKYGIGVDKIDVEVASELGLPVFFTPGVNHTTVAEHTFMLLLMLVKKAIFHANKVSDGEWKRQTGNEIFGKNIGIVGLGRIGKEVVIRAKAFGLKVFAYDVYWDEAFANEHEVTRAKTYEDIWENSDFISLHTNLNEKTHHLLNKDTFSQMKEGVMIVNCARGEIVNTEDMVAALKEGRVGGYGTDVLDQEPPEKEHPLLSEEKCIITP
ncbi:MAG: phosphoglycerate dehydrogenase, partial [Opitutales bacterium]|nr:phosphoglycerate dehydrogenase [Opitutales bacterium]